MMENHLLDSYEEQYFNNVDFIIVSTILGGKNRDRYLPFFIEKVCISDSGSCKFGHIYSLSCDLPAKKNM